MILLIYFFFLSIFALPVSCADSKSDVDSNENVKIEYLDILSKIQARFATTFVTSRVQNKAKSASEITFAVQLPDAAFITNFSMLINDKTVYGDVKEKEEAKQAFEAAKSRGESTGLIAKKTRESNIFAINVNIAAESKISFNLTYQEILQRIHGVYKHVVDVHPTLPADRISIVVEILERGQIIKLKVPKFDEKIGEKTNKELLAYEDEKNAVITSNVSSSTQSFARVSFEPKFSKNGQLVVLYDLQRNTSESISTIEVVDGYFVHFFAPENLQRGNRKLIFVLDKSGSMSGRKIDQLRDGAKAMLDDMSSDDFFDIVFFSTQSELWKPELVRATGENVKEAKDYIGRIVAKGSTDISGSLSLAIKTLSQSVSSRQGPDALAPAIFFLTDGQPTEGIMEPDLLVKNITSLNKESKNLVIHCIGFGDDVDIKLMRRIASNNGGLAKKVFTDSDAALQLTGFYDQISNPVLIGLNFTYLNDTVDTQTLVSGGQQTNSYYRGGEVVTFGRLKNGVSIQSGSLQADVTGIAQAGSVAFRTKSSPWICPRYDFGCCPMPMDVIGGIRRPPYCCWRPWCPPPPPPLLITPAPKVPPPSNTLGGFIERMWAYQTIKKQLNQMELQEDVGKKNELKKKALDLSLRYNFVTDLTSMVVVQPNELKPGSLEKVEPSALEANKQGVNVGAGKGSSSGFGFPSGRPGPEGFLGPMDRGGNFAGRKPGSFPILSGAGEMPEELAEKEIQKQATNIPENPTTKVPKKCSDVILVRDNNDSSYENIPQTLKSIGDLLPNRKIEKLLLPLQNGVSDKYLAQALTQKLTPSVKMVIFVPENLFLESTAKILIDWIKKSNNIKVVIVSLTNKNVGWMKNIDKPNYLLISPRLSDIVDKLTC